MPKILDLQNFRPVEPPGESSPFATAMPVPDQSAATGSPMLPRNGPTQTVVAHRLYVKIRTQFPQYNHEQAILTMVHALKTGRDKLPPNAPPPDERYLRRLSADLEWDFQWVSAQTKIELARPDTEARSDVETLEELLRQQYEIFKAAQRDLSPVLLLGDDGSQSVGAPPPGASQRAAVAWATYEKIKSSLKEAKEELRKTTLERTDTKAFKNRVEEKFNAIYGEYNGIGTIYEVLCRQLAEVIVQREDLLNSGRNATALYESLTKTQLLTIQQIQKHTESTKSETASTEMKDMFKRMMLVIEPIISPENPDLWQKTLRALVTAWPKENTLAS